MDCRLDMRRDFVEEAQEVWYRNQIAMDSIVSLAVGSIVRHRSSHMVVLPVLQLRGTAAS